MLGLTREGTTIWTRDTDGTLISQKADSSSHYYLRDNLGSVVGLADGAGGQAQIPLHPVPTGHPLSL